MLDADTLKKLANLRIVFLIDEIHRSNSGAQHEEMVNIFDALQTPFEKAAYRQTRTKKNLIVGFTATPDDTTLARFGEFSGYAESEKLWVPFDAYTMNEAITDGFILNPIKNIVPVASKLLFDLPSNSLEGFKEPNYKDVDKKQIYQQPERIDAIAQYIADLLVKDVYRQIRGTAKAMLAVYSIEAAIAYQRAIIFHFNYLVQQPKYEKYGGAPVHVIYSSSQDKQNASSLNDGMSEEKVLENFALSKNGLIIVVAKLQTGFDEKRLHTLFLRQRNSRYRSDSGHLPRQPNGQIQKRLQSCRFLLQQRQRSKPQRRLRTLLRCRRQRFRSLLRSAPSKYPLHRPQKNDCL